VPGSKVNDVTAQAKVTRYSDSTDPAGVLRVQGVVALCTNADCSSVTPIGSNVDLGTVNVGQAVVLQMTWDKPNKTFSFSRDNGAIGGSVVYTQNDLNAPSSSVRLLSTRMDLANCKTGGVVPGMVDASFDNVFVNASATP